MEDMWVIKIRCIDLRKTSDNVTDQLYGPFPTRERIAMDLKEKGWDITVSQSGERDGWISSCDLPLLYLAEARQLKEILQDPTRIPQKKESL